ncbi:MAG: hypothetical protein HUU45_13735, partial [Leptospiraceae bacterium]|nr:hypothetical protein [Leptospiraceae bacterium]
QAMQGQDSTLDVYGKYVNGGGSLVSNAELAKIGIARAKISGGDHTTNLYEKDTGAHYKKGDLYQWKDEKTGKEYLDVRKEDEKQRYKLKQNNKDVLGIQFGLSQGIGGTAGAELFAKLEKYGQFGGSKNDMKKIMSDAIHSGFTGLRQSEFFQTVSGISEKSYNSGMGIQTAADVSNTLAGIKMTGVRDNRISSVYGAMDSGFKTSGNIMNSIAMAGHLSSGKGILESMKESEKGVTSKQNMGFMKELLGGLDPETRGILEKQWGISTATEAQERVVNGKNLWEVNEQINRQATGTDAAVNKVEGTTGQSYRSTQNAIDTMAATDKTFQQAFQLQQDVAIGLLHLAKNLSKEFQELKKKIE